MIKPLPTLIILLSFLQVQASGDFKEQISGGSLDLSSEEEMTGSSFTTVASNFSEDIKDGKAVAISDQAVAFFNPKIDYEAELADLKDKAKLRDELFYSEKDYVCADQYITGFVGEPRTENEDNIKIPTGSVVSLLDDEPVEHQIGETEYIYVKLMFDDKEYWSASRIGERPYITQYKDCPSIQSNVFNAEWKKRSSNNSKEEVIAGVPITSVESSSPSVKYICVSQTLNVYKDKELTEQHQLQLGDQVKILQGEKYEPFVQDVRGTDYEFVAFEHEGKAYWAASDFIKKFSDCDRLAREAVDVCTSAGGSVNYRGERIVSDLRGQFQLGDVIYKNNGHVYSHIVAELDGQVHKYLPVTKTPNSSEVYWVVEDVINYKSCEALERGIDVVRTCRGFDPVRNRSGNITGVKKRSFLYTLNTKDEFPLTSRPISSYFEGPGRFYHSRSGRRHAATDLYTRTLSTKGRDRGENFRAINDGLVIRIDSFYCGTYQITVRNENGTVYSYGEIVNPDEKSARDRFGKFIPGKTRVKAGQLLGQTLHVGGCASSYPVMLHLEKYSGKKSGSLTQSRRVNIFARRNDLENPSCHIQDLERKKFNGRSYANPYQ
jgi:hypothetical protein